MATETMHHQTDPRGADEREILDDHRAAEFRVVGEFTGPIRNYAGDLAKLGAGLRDAAEGAVSGEVVKTTLSAEASAFLDQDENGEPRLVSQNPQRPSTTSRVPVHELIGRLRAASTCKACGKTRVVINVAARGFRAERVTPETHCACVGGPAHVPDRSAEP